MLDSQEIHTLLQSVLLSQNCHTTCCCSLQRPRLCSIPTRTWHPKWSLSRRTAWFKKMGGGIQPPQRWRRAHLGGRGLEALSPQFNGIRSIFPDGMLMIDGPWWSQKKTCCFSQKNWLKRRRSQKFFLLHHSFWKLGALKLLKICCPGQRALSGPSWTTMHPPERNYSGCSAFGRGCLYFLIHLKHLTQQDRSFMSSFRSQMIR